MIMENTLILDKTLKTIFLSILLIYFFLNMHEMSKKTHLIWSRGSIYILKHYPNQQPTNPRRPFLQPTYGGLFKVGTKLSMDMSTEIGIRTNQI
jgi:hypothetical protein